MRNFWSDVSVTRSRFPFRSRAHWENEIPSRSGGFGRVNQTMLTETDRSVNTNSAGRSKFGERTARPERQPNGRLACCRWRPRQRLFGTTALRVVDGNVFGGGAEHGTRG